MDRHWPRGTHSLSMRVLGSNRPFQAPSQSDVLEETVPWVYFYNSFEEAAEVLLSRLLTHNRATHDHCRRVGELAGRLAARLGLDIAARERLQRAALVHDVGKLAVATYVLDAPRAPTPTEWAAIRLHPVRASELLRSVPQFRDIAAIVHTHHEHFDGSGYPEGMSGATIPLESRILAVADALDAMKASHPYRKGLAAAESVAEVHRAAGTQFDPDVVDSLEPVLSAMVR